MTKTVAHPDATARCTWTTHPAGERTTVKMRGESHTVLWISRRRQYSAYGVSHDTWRGLMAWLRSLPTD